MIIVNLTDKSLFITTNKNRIYILPAPDNSGHLHHVASNSRSEIPGEVLIPKPVGED